MDTDEETSSDYDEEKEENEDPDYEAYDDLRRDNMRGL